MKKFIATACILGTALALSACTTKGEGHYDEAPYASERTAGQAPEGSTADAERTFSKSMRK